jgi:predicted DNA-binding protein with PD1-like motif
MFCYGLASAEAQSAQFMPPAEAAPHGSAPGMKVKLLTHGGDVREYAVIFSPGDDPLAGMTEFAQKYHVQSAHFTAIGSFAHAHLAWLDKQKHMFRVIPAPQQMEVTSLIGDIAIANGKPVVHMHCVLAAFDGTTLGGHILDARVFPTLEVFVTVDPVPLYKEKQPQTGISVIDPDATH